MKSEHRHDLKTNELGRLVTKATPFLERYSNHILIVLGAIIVIGGIAVYWATRKSVGCRLDGNAQGEHGGAIRRCRRQLPQHRGG